jgi:cbb3-type cytochrome oxidase maturation protein
MDVLYLLVPLSVVLVFLISVVFWWAVHNGQFEDLDGPAHQILMDDDEARPSRMERREPAAVAQRQTPPARPLARRKP